MSIERWLLLTAILLALGGLTGCPYNNPSGGAAGEGSVGKTLTELPAEVRGVWDGQVQGEGAPAEARVVLGRDPHLIVRGQTINRLAGGRIEPLPEQPNSTEQRYKLVLRGQPTQAGAPAAEKVTLELLPHGYGMSIQIDWAGPADEHGRKDASRGTLAKATELDKSLGRSTAYFKYADWRMQNPQGLDPKGRLKQTIDEVARRMDAKLLDGTELTIKPGAPPAVWGYDQPRMTRRLYLFYCPRGGDHLAIRVAGGAARVMSPGPLDYPAIVIDPSGLSEVIPMFTVQFRQDDPDQPIQSEPVTGPLKMTILVFGRKGDHGLGYDLDRIEE